MKLKVDQLNELAEHNENAIHGLSEVFESNERLGNGISGLTQS
jgi:hypothetical protein